MNPVFSFGGEKGIRTPDTVIAVYTISNRAPSASSDISPFVAADYYITNSEKNQAFFESFFIFLVYSTVSQTYIENVQKILKTLSFMVA